MARFSSMLMVGAVSAVAVAGWQLSRAWGPADEPAVPASALVDTVPEAQTAAAPEKPVEPAQSARVKIDTLRVDPSGLAVLAGRIQDYRAEDQAAASYQVRLGEQELAVIAPESDGSFVSFLTIPAPQEPQMLRVIGPTGDADSVDILIAPQADPVQSVPDPAPQAAPRPDAQHSAPDAVSAEAEPAEEDPESPAQELPQETSDPVVLVSDAQGVRLVQGGSEAAPQVESVIIDTIAYDLSGQVAFAGRAPRGGGDAVDGAVRLYLDNRPVATAPVQQDGAWALDLPPDVGRGVYTLRIDQLNAQGAVVSRIESPFKREAPGDVAAALADGAGTDPTQVAVRTVQPGNTLWAIAREKYGDGMLFVHVFRANSDLIRDPDLIYPGQIFRLPALPTTSSAARP